MLTPDTSLILRALEEKKRAMAIAEEQRRRKALEERRKEQKEATERFKSAISRLKNTSKTQNPSKSSSMRNNREMHVESKSGVLSQTGE